MDRFARKVGGERFALSLYEGRVVRLNILGVIGASMGHDIMAEQFLVVVAPPIGFPGGLPEVGSEGTVWQVSRHLLKAFDSLLPLLDFPGILHVLRVEVPMR